MSSRGVSKLVTDMPSFIVRRSCSNRARHRAAKTMAVWSSLRDFGTARYRPKSERRRVRSASLRALSGDVVKRCCISWSSSSERSGLGGNGVERTSVRRVLTLKIKDETEIPEVLGRSRSHVTHLCQCTTALIILQLHPEVPDSV